MDATTITVMAGHYGPHGAIAAIGTGFHWVKRWAEDVAKAKAAGTTAPGFLAYVWGSLPDALSSIGATTTALFGAASIGLLGDVSAASAAVAWACGYLGDSAVYPIGKKS